ncbi:2OG-Fe(II) oxygenase family protein [Aliamphritea spongicola]|nr:2OG-Fe(II) oxygenase family protein [Aliamphritea spongicola]
MPDTPTAFRETFERYHGAMMKLAEKLISAIALSLNLPADYFAKLQQNPITIQRLLHYPSQSGDIRQEEIGIGAHTDYGFLTILGQDNNGGLQVQNRQGEWIDAPPVEDTFIVNIGDLVQTFTNDKYISTMHRVINTSGRERYSLPFFIDLISMPKSAWYPPARATLTRQNTSPIPAVSTSTNASSTATNIWVSN